MVDEQIPLKRSSIEQILFNIGYGKYQKQVYYILGIGLFCQGMEISLLSLLVVVLQDAWGLNEMQMGLLGGSVFAGMIAGSFVSSAIGDDVGRLGLLRWSTLGIFLSGFISAFMPEFYSFCLVRGLVGVFICVSIPPSNSYASEICDISHRGPYNLSFGLMWNAGQIAIVLLGILLMPNLDGDSPWRIILIISTIPSLASYIMLFFTVVESPVFLANQENHNEAIQSFNAIALYNNNQELGDLEEEAVMKIGSKYEQKGSAKFKILLYEENYHTTIPLMISWSTAILIGAGITFILPLSLNESSSLAVYTGLLISSLFGIPGIILAMSFIENPNFGRKKTMIFGYVGQSISLLLSAFFVNSMIPFIICIGFANFFYNIAINVLFPYTVEVYRTEVRNMALGLGQTFGDIMNSIIPIILLVSLSMSPQAPYIVLLVFSVLGLWMTLKLPKETMGKSLDED